MFACSRHPYHQSHLPPIPRHLCCTPPPHTHTSVLHSPPPHTPALLPAPPLCTSVQLEVPPRTSPPGQEQPGQVCEGVCVGGRVNGWVSCGDFESGAGGAAVVICIAATDKWGSEGSALHGPGPGKPNVEPLHALPPTSAHLTAPPSSRADHPPSSRADAPPPYPGPHLTHQGR